MKRDFQPLSIPFQRDGVYSWRHDQGENRAAGGSAKVLQGGAGGWCTDRWRYQPDQIFTMNWPIQIRNWVVFIKICLCLASSPLPPLVKDSHTPGAQVFECLVLLGIRSQGLSKNCTVERSRKSVVLMTVLWTGGSSGLK